MCCAALKGAFAPRGGPSALDARFVATWTFDEVEGGTLVTIHGLFPTDADRDYVVATFGALEGGEQTLARLDDYLATKR